MTFTKKALAFIKREKIRKQEDSQYRQMEYEIHYPTEQYGFILKKIEGTDEDAVREYQSLHQEWINRNKAGLESKEWNAVLDRYLHGDEKMEADKHAAMSERQQKLINEIKKSNNRNK